MPLQEQYLVNFSSLSEFILLEFSEVRELQILHFVIFLIFYLLTAAGNLLIISAVVFDHHLHTPMFFFLMNLAMQDLGQVSVIVPKSMANSLFNTRSITYSGCVTQVFLFIFFLVSDLCLLTLMAHDRYVAICNPLQYEMLMNKHACIQMVIAIWATSLLYGALHTSGTFATPFCSNMVNQFFCEIPKLINLACSNHYSFEFIVLLIFTPVGVGCFAFVVVTYLNIFSAVFKIPSVQGRQKVFSTCLPHLIVFSLLIVTGGFAYFKPTSNSGSCLDLVFSVLYSMVPPLINPIIYSLRNKEIQNALKKILQWKQHSMNKSTHIALQR